MAAPEEEQLVWYAAYGSNLRRERFLCYLTGGRPDGGRRAYAGSRDPGPPRAESVLRFAGGLAFGGESSVWTGGMAVYDPHGSAEVVARTYLLTLGQLSDVVAQEIRRMPGTDIARDLVRHGGPHGLGAGLYDTLVNLGEVDGHPVLTITAARVPPPTTPAEAYLRSIAGGLADAFGFTAAEIASYLAPAAGLTGVWTRERLLALGGAGVR